MRSTRNEEDETTQVVTNHIKSGLSEELMCNNTPQLIYDWIAEYQRIINDSGDLSAFAAEHETDPDIAEAIFTVFNERQRHEQLIHAICQQLLCFYRCNEEILRRFPMQFIPVLVHNYLQAVAAADKRSARAIETLLICIYNAEISTEDGAQRAVTFRMPILAHPSVYHEEKNLPLTDLRRWEENSNREVKWGPHVHIEAITAHTRLRILTALLFCYNQQLSQMQKPALLHLCRVTSQLVNQGFTKQTTHAAHRISFGSSTDQGSLPKCNTPRIPLSAAFLVELVHAIYFAMFNGYGNVAIQTLEDIHTRACYEMYPDLILVTSAVRNSLHANPSGQPSDGPMGLSVALTPATNTVTTAVSKSMITNASFRTKKLPDDIPIQAQDGTMQQVSQPLTSVLEESDVSGKEQSNSGTPQQTSTRNSIIRPSMEGIKAQAHKALIAGFKKSKDKEKEREKEKEKEKIKEKELDKEKEKEPPKVPQRKFEKHSQRNSLLQLQAEGSVMAMAAAAAVVEYEKRAGVTYDSLDSMEMLPIQVNLDNNTIGGSGSFSVDSELNGMAAGVNNTSTNVNANKLSSNNNTNNNNNSMVSNITNNSISTTGDMLTTKSFDTSMELPNMGVANKLTEVLD